MTKHEVFFHKKCAEDKGFKKAVPVGEEPKECLRALHSQNKKNIGWK